MFILVEIIKLYLQLGKFFGKFDTYFTQRNDDVLTYFAIFILLPEVHLGPSSKVELFLRKWLTTLSR